jgi:hypothetical protein
MMKRAIPLLIGSLFFGSAIARDFTFAWDPVVMNPPPTDVNYGYDNTRTFYELRTKLNDGVWVNTITAPEITQIVKTIPIVPNDRLIVQIRSRAGQSWVCDRTITPDCDKSQWVSFSSLPTVDTAITYPTTPGGLIVSLPGDISSLQLTGVSLGSDPGSVMKNDDVWDMTARGHDIWGNTDGGYFAYVPKTGNFEIVARVVSIQRPPPHGWAKAGIMIRENLTAGSRHVFMTATGSNGVSFQSRSTAGGTSISASSSGIIEPVFVKLNRSGNVFTASYSVNGVTWISFSSRTITMSSNVYAGLASTSHSSGITFSSSFDSLQGF